jgi:hypothetical protein
MRRLKRKTDVKKTLTRFGEIAILKTNPYMKGVHHGFGISPYMQELMTYAGHPECYARSHEIPEQFLSLEASPLQVYRGRIMYRNH